ncbi:prolyl oligopeptidase family serine peptidase [Streptomyces sp. SAS_272]|uniref:prolyl oligopeptidase family serine peptidase n=1 Tax=Streptomyces sp. SAS_272 TaxID=3412747 RepID=UPI00403C2CD3
MSGDFERSRRYRRTAPDGRAALELNGPVHPSARERNPAAVQWRGLTLDPALAGLVPARARPDHADLHLRDDPGDPWRLPVPALLPSTLVWHPRLPLLAGLAVSARDRTAYLWTADHASRTTRTYPGIPAATGLTALGPSGQGPVGWLDDGRLALLLRDGRSSRGPGRLDGRETAEEPDREQRAAGPQDVGEPWRPVRLEAAGPRFVSFEPDENALLQLAGTQVAVLDLAEAVPLCLTPPLLVRGLRAAGPVDLLLDHAHDAGDLPDDNGLRWTRSLVSTSRPGRLRRRDDPAPLPAQPGAPLMHDPAPAAGDKKGDKNADGDALTGPPADPAGPRDPEAPAEAADPGARRHRVDTGSGAATLTVLPDGAGAWLLWIRALRQGERPSPAAPVFLPAGRHRGAVLDLPLYWPEDATPKILQAQIVVAVEEAVAVLRAEHPAPVVVGGHSFGATVSLYALAHAEGLAGAVAHSGCYNRTLTPTGFHYERRTLWQARQMYREFSALDFADRLRGPVLLVHGAEDANPATPADQAVGLYRAVVATGGRARLLLLPGEGHTFHSREALRAVTEEHDDWLGRC